MGKGDILRASALTGVVFCCAGLPVEAGAQEQNGSAPVAAQESSAFNADEIIVTARRREESMQTVPIAVTVVSPEALESNNVQTLGDLQRLVPSMTAATGLGKDGFNVSIRGQGTNSIGSQPGVVAYLNEVPIPTDVDSFLAGGPGLLFDLDNVQVLKGPQGTLFGRNSVGGAMLLQSARPTNELGGELSAGYGNYNNREVRGFVNLPIVDDMLLARIAFTGAERDGYTRVLSTPSHPGGVDADSRSYFGVRGTVTFRPTDAIQNDTIVTWTRYDSENGSPFFLTAVNPSGAVAGLFPALLAQQQALGSRTHIGVSDDITSSGDYLMISNITDIELSSDITLRNIFGFADAQTNVIWDLDGTPEQILDQPSQTRRYPFRQYTEEVQLQGNSFDGHLDWTVGAFYLKSPFPDHTILQPGVVFGFPNDSRSERSSESTAGYAQGVYSFGGDLTGLRLTAGVRYTRDHLVAHSIYGGLFTVCPSTTSECTVFGSPVPVVTGNDTSSAVTWTLGLDYQVSPDTLVYAASHRGYRSGGSNSGVAPNFTPEYVTDFELGTKSDWTLGNMPVRTNVALYYQDYTDIQVQRVDSSVGLTPFTANAAGARLWGVELEATAEVTDRLQVGVNFDYLNFEYTEFEDGVQPDTIAALRASESLGRPAIKYGVYARYQLPISPDTGELFVQANWSWQDENGSTAIPTGMIPAYGLLNVSADWNGIFGSQVDASFYASNLLDEEYKTSVFDSYNVLGYVSAFYGEPQMYGLRLSYHFGN